MLPSLTKDGRLPKGIHRTTLEELQKQFGVGARREELFQGLRRALRNLKSAGVVTVYLDGSFVTSKIWPGDIDGCWDAHPGVDPAKLDAVFLDFSNKRARMKHKYGVDFFPSQMVEAKAGVPFVEFFQTDKDGLPRGIVAIDLAKEDLK